MPVRTPGTTAGAGMDRHSVPRYLQRVDEAAELQADRLRKRELNGATAAGDDVDGRVAQVWRIPHLPASIDPSTTGIHELISRSNSM